VSKSAVFKVMGIAILVIGILLVFSACGGGNGLVGKWANPTEGESIEFTSDGKAISNGDEAPYKTEGDQLTLTVQGVDMTFTYVVKDDTLTLTIMGQSMTYTRVAE
jgi:uncharacterized lipoprotein YehR (DUF1307 family)